MHLMGVEPIRINHWDLNPARLPISPQVQRIRPAVFQTGHFDEKWLSHEVIIGSLELRRVLGNLPIREAALSQI